MKESLMVEEKHTYAVGSKEGPVLYDGTMYKSQKDLNDTLGITFVIVGIISFFIGIVTKLSLFCYGGVAIGILGLMMFFGGRVKQAE